MLLLRRLDRWAQASQRGARRNAMVASTEAVRRRAEREDAEAYVAAATARRTDPRVEHVVVQQVAVGR